MRESLMKEGSSRVIIAFERRDDVTGSANSVLSSGDIGKLCGSCHLLDPIGLGSPITPLPRAEWMGERNSVRS
jgi:hypothetical protein